MLFFALRNFCVTKEKVEQPKFQIKESVARSDAVEASLTGWLSRSKNIEIYVFSGINR